MAHSHSGIDLTAMLKAAESGSALAKLPVENGCPLALLRGRLRRAGLRPTRQRLSLGWLLFGHGDRHVTAEMLYDEAISAKVLISLATVYNTLRQFTEAGLLRQLSFDGTKAYFDTDTSEHHHFYCDEEERVIDMPDFNVVMDTLPQPPEGMEVQQIEIIVRLKKKSGLPSRLRVEQLDD